MNREQLPTTDRAISPVCAALFSVIAEGDAAMLTRVRHFVLDAEDAASDRWMMFRLAERDAWKTVELYLLQRLIERRFREGELDAWVKTTPFGEELKNAIQGEYDQYGSFDWPAEPQDFDVTAFQELRAARLAGELYAERATSDVARDPADGSLETMNQFASCLQEKFPHLAQVIRHQDLDIVALAWDFLSFRMRANETMQREAGPIGDAIFARSSSSNSDLAPHLYRRPEAVEELIGDVYAQAELRRRMRLEEGRRNSQPVTREEAKQAVEEMLGRSVEIHAATLSEAIAEAERLKEADDLMVAINSLWAWFQKLPAEEQSALGKFSSKTALWTSRRTLQRVQERRET